MMAKHSSASTTSSTKSFKSLASKASSNLKNIKQKATELLSPKKKKKTKHLPDDHGNTSLDPNNPDSNPPSEKSLHGASNSVIDISDGKDAEEELSK